MATKKLTALTAATPEDGDIAYIVKDPTGTPVDRKANVSDFGVVRMTSTTLTDAQIKALPSTSRTIVAAPGAGKAIFLLGWWMRINWVADYTNIHAASVLELTTNLTGGRLDNAVAGDVDSLLAGGGPDGVSGMGSFTGRVPASGSPALLNGVAGFYDSDVEDEPLILRATNSGGDFTGGNAGNSMTVTAIYVVIDL